MEKEVINLYPNGIVGTQTELPTITVFRPYIQTGKGAILIFAGGGYAERCCYEDEGYAEYIRSLGIMAFVVSYRCKPAKFPDELMDARVAVRYVRKNAEKYGIDGDKIAVMGSSAGGHLCALLSTYQSKLENEEKTENVDIDYLPSAQILCYPVISSNNEIVNEGTYRNLLGDNYSNKDDYSPELLVHKNTPKAFIWHTFEDKQVNVINSYLYAINLRKMGISTELHIFPNGAHGANLANDKPNVAEWKRLLENWLRLNNYL